MPQHRVNQNTQQNWQYLRVLTFYRIILAGLLTALYFLTPDSNPFSITNHPLFRATLTLWLGFSVVIGFTTRLQLHTFRLQALLQVLVDITAIAVLMFASDGINSSLSILLIIAVASGAMMLPGRLAYLFAATGTLALLAATGLQTLSTSSNAGDITQTGLFGAALFMVAGLAHALAVRARDSEALAAQRGIDLENLEELNQYIIGHLQSGVLVIDNEHQIRLANEMAKNLLGLPAENQLSLHDTTPDLFKILTTWKNNQQLPTETISSSDKQHALLPQFSQVKTGGGNGTLIFLEDSSRLEQQAQQLKLASLGRLTASIAHEIRNPLGAISHAAQLLEESEQRTPEDQRLTEIIGNHTKRVDAIIESVLQLSRRTTTKTRELALKTWLQQFREDFSHIENYAPEYMIIDVQPDNLSVHIDPGHLDQILTNLCENAFRHADTRALIRLEAHNDNGTVHLNVIDNGPGIDEATIDKIFEPFFTTAGTGTGLGLYIARELCEINHAQLTYHAVANAGSCFRIQFRGA